LKIALAIPGARTLKFKVLLSFNFLQPTV